jgi:hypothetical protein
MDSDRGPGVTSADEQFLAAFETGLIANQSFRHRDHLRLAWLQIRQLGFERASDKVAGGIQHFAARHGKADRYNDTMTRFWLRAVGIGIRRHPMLSFEQLLEAEPHLLQKDLPFLHWSRERMGSEEARKRGGTGRNRISDRCRCPRSLGIGSRAIERAEPRRPELTPVRAQLPGGG